MGAPLEMFLTGLALGVGPCMLFCLPILIPFVAGTVDGWIEGLKAAIVFSLSRLMAYVLLGLVAGLSGEVLIGFLGRAEFGNYVWAIGGSFISLLGILILLGGESRLMFWRPLFGYPLKYGLGSLVLLGFIVGVTPCATLLGILTYIALSVRTPMAGAYYSLCFGLGAAITTPVTLLGMIAGGAPRLIFRTPKVREVFKRSCGLILVLLGARQIFSQFLSGTKYW